MKFLEHTDWETVFEKWRENEADDPVWVECATRIKGWPDWESWRRFTAIQLGASQLKWDRYLLEDPAEELPLLFVGPFRGWRERLRRKSGGTFAELMSDPEQVKFFEQHKKVLGMVAGFPHPTELIAVRRQDTGELICIEGHHRCAAAALAKARGRPINFAGPVTLALADLPEDQVQVLEEMLKRGSTRA